jgi:hypothetical protein
MLQFTGLLWKINLHWKTLPTPFGEKAYVFNRGMNTVDGNMRGSSIKYRASSSLEKPLTGWWRSPCR